MQDQQLDDFCGNEGVFFDSGAHPFLEVEVVGIFPRSEVKADVGVMVAVPALGGSDRACHSNSNSVEKP